MKPETVKELIDSGKSSDEIRDILIEEANIASRLGYIRREILKEEDKHTKAIESLEKELAEVRKKCKHYEKTYYADTYERSVECSLCGQELLR